MGSNLLDKLDSKGGGGGVTNPVVTGFVDSTQNVKTPGGAGARLVGAPRVSRAGTTAISVAYQGEGEIVPCSTDPSKCDEGDTGIRKVNSFTMNRAQSVDASVKVEGNTAGSTLEGESFVSNAPRAWGGVDPRSGLIETGYDTDNENGGTYVETKKVAGIDSFFFFESESYSTTNTGNSFKGTGTHVAGVQGNLAPEAKVKTATFKGKGSGSADVGDYNTEAEYNYKSDSVIEANLTTKKMNVTQTVTDGFKAEDGSFNGIGSKILLTGVDIYGNTFSGGSLSIERADGTARATFEQGDTMAAGGFYGDNAEYAAGVLTGVGAMTENGTQYQVRIDGEFWGRDDAQPIAPVTQ
jgi:hypothetical protein